MSKKQASGLSELAVRSGVQAALEGGVIVSAFKALGMTGLKLVAAQGEWELPEGDYVFLMLATRSGEPSFGAEMVQLNPESLPRAK